MTEKRRRLQERVAAAKQEAADYLRDANEDAKRIFALPLNWLNDVQTFWLDSSMPDPRQEDWWLDRAEESLDFAIESFRRRRAQVDQFGGPARVRAIGG